MDIVLARTFLEVVSTGSFIATAESMHLTQTAVSARIRSLEKQLGRQLFVRNKAGARLTPAGERLVRHAATLIQVWERARQQVALPAGRREGISIGAELSVWNPLLADWLSWMHRECPDIALRTSIDKASDLLAQVEDGSLDLAVLYHPQQKAGLVAELLAEEKLIMVTTAADGHMNGESYIYVDWGPSYAANHQAAFPELSNPATSISLGPLALGHLLSVGGSGYFRQGIVQPMLADGRLRRVRHAPEFSYSAYVIYVQGAPKIITDSLKGLRTVARMEVATGP
ncbi:MAG: LysR family transcriptional regulator [Phyllobacterium sp.]